MHEQSDEQKRQRDIHGYAPVARRWLYDPEIFDIHGFTGAIAGVRSGRTRAAFATTAVRIAGEVTAYANLVPNPDLLDLIANELIFRDQVIVRQLVHVERVPCLHVTRKHIAREDAVPEIDLVQFACCVVTPHHADIEHNQMVVCLQVHAAVALVMTVGNDHSGQVVSVFGFYSILDVVNDDSEWALIRRHLLGFFGDLGHILDIARQIVSVPERNEQPYETRCDKDVVKSHQSVQGPFTKISVTVKRPGANLAANDEGMP